MKGALKGHAMSYDSFSELVEPYLSGPSNAMPAALSQRAISVYSLWGSWDDLKPDQRRSVAVQHDSQNNPALREWRKRIVRLTDEMETRQGQIAAWERLEPERIAEMGVKEAKLAALNAEVAALHQQLITPFSATPVQAQNPAAPAPVETVEPARPDPERRLALLRELGGAAKYTRGEWTFPGIKTLVDSEKANGHKRSSEKTIRADLREAAQSERDEKRAGFTAGLGHR